MYYFCRKSASCTHVSAVLHVLANLSPPTFRLKPNVDVTIGEEEEEMPCTSVPRQWGIPSKKRKDSSIEISTAVFEKHDYSKPVKKESSLLKILIQGHRNVLELYNHSFLSFWIR